MSTRQSNMSTDAIIVAIIGAIATIVAAVITNYYNHRPHTNGIGSGGKSFQPVDPLKNGNVSINNAERKGDSQTEEQKQIEKIPKGVFIFITGTNGVGKTTIAAELAKKCNILNIIGTNTLRQTLRSRKDLFEVANKLEEYDLLKDSTIDLDGHDKYNEQCALLSKTIVDVANYYARDNGAIFEGINISPNDIDKYTDKVEGRALFIVLTIDDREELKKRLLKKAYNDQCRAKYKTNIDKIFETQEEIRHDFQSKNMNDNRFIVHNDDSIDKTVNKVVEIIERFNKKV